VPVRSANSPASGLRPPAGGLRTFSGCLPYMPHRFNPRLPLEGGDCSKQISSCRCCCCRCRRRCPWCGLFQVNISTPTPIPPHPPSKKLFKSKLMTVISTPTPKNLPPSPPNGYISIYGPMDPNGPRAWAQMDPGPRPQRDRGPKRVPGPNGPRGPGPKWARGPNGRGAQMGWPRDLGPNGPGPGLGYNETRLPLGCLLKFYLYPT